MNSERASTNTKVKKRKLFLIKEIYEIKKTTQDMTEKLNKDMENLRKSNKEKS
jgi:hypothetical protein